ncbi:MAG: 16S rRNA (cytosine(1402)-N(4))-methyltransferase RsmH [Pirellulales bacterium]|nr:16S rRNA (cytosine(1402)-N(4))-methyltransferase RsmH [Pirellulales bacterium]
MSEPSPVHVAVLLDETIDWLDPQPGKVMVDGTYGAGGHARAMAERVGPDGQVIGIDRDPAAIDEGHSRLGVLPIRLVQANYCNLPEVLEAFEMKTVDGIVLDLGLSSDQLADPNRGFSFSGDGPLDLRFDPTRGQATWQMVNRLSEGNLADLIYAYGEERYSRRIAKAIVNRRRESPIRTAAELAELVRRCVPRKGHDRIDPATRTFQALRIAANDELESLDIALRRLPDCLSPGGRMAVISFHSLEDRRVKEAFRNDDRMKALTKKPIRPTPEEVERNPRARSAKLRIAERT